MDLDRATARSISPSRGRGGRARSRSCTRPTPCPREPVGPARSATIKQETTPMHGLPPRGTDRDQPVSDQPSPTNPGGSVSGDPAIPVLAQSAQPSTRTLHSAQGGRSASVNDAAVTTCPHRAITRPLRARSRPINSSLTRWVPIPIAGHGHPRRAGMSWPITRLCASTHDASPQRPPVGGAEGRDHAGTTATLQSQLHVHPHSRSADCSRAADGDAGESVASRARPGRTRATPSDPFEETGARRPGHDRRAGHALLRAAGMHAWLPDRAPAHEGRHGGG